MGRLGLDGKGRLAVGLNQRVDREALGLHRDALCVHLHLDQKTVALSKHAIPLSDDYKSDATEDSISAWFDKLFQEKGISLKTMHYIFQADFSFAEMCTGVL